MLLLPTAEALIVQRGEGVPNGGWAVIRPEVCDRSAASAGRSRWREGED